MRKHNTTSRKLPRNKQNKGKQIEAQMQRVFAAFNRKPSTMLMVSIETGIERANICRYVAKWQKWETIALTKKGFCEISKYWAGYYTTDPKKFPAKRQTQLKLF